MPQKQFVPDDFEPINDSSDEFIPHDFEPLEMTYAIVNGQKIPLGSDEADVIPRVASPEEPQVNDNSTISKLLKPLVDVSPETRQHMEEFGHATLSDTPASARLKGFASGALTPLLDMIVGNSSILNAGLMGTGALETTAAKAGFPLAEQLLKIPSRAAGAGMIAHGGYDLSQGNNSGGQIGGDILEMLLGGLAAKGPSTQTGDLKLKKFTEQPLPEESAVNSLEIPEPKIGTPPFNTSQFGLHPTDESNPLLSHVPNRLRPPSTNATVFDALLPERLKLNEQGAATPPTTSVGENRFNVPKLKVEMPRIDLTPDEVKTVSNWKQRAQHFWSDETGAVGKISGLKARDQLSDALDQAMIGREFQEDLYSSERAKRFARVEKIKTPGFKGVYQKLGAMKGELPKVNFEPLTNLHESTKAMLLREIDRSDLKTGEKLRASVGLGKLLGESDKGAQVPQRGEIELLGRVFGQDFSDRIIQMHSGVPITRRAANEVFNFTKSNMASGDMSFPFRQGLPLWYRKEWWQSWGPMINQMKSKAAFEGAQAAVTSDPTYGILKKAGVRFADVDQRLEKGEEMFKSDIAAKLPWVDISERGYVGFANNLRLWTGKNMMKAAEKAGKELYTVRGEETHPTQITRDIAKFVNNHTGVGSLDFRTEAMKEAGIKVGNFEKIAPELNYVFWSPRLQASKMARYSAVFNPNFWTKLDPMVRKESLKSLFAVAGFIGITNAVGSMFRGESTKDLTSSDFGKEKFGNTRLDPGAGDLQYVVLASRLIDQARKQMIESKKPGFGQSMTDIAGRFVRSKESPMVAFAHDLLSGSDMLGRKFNLSREVQQMMLPMVVNDAISVWKEDPELAPLIPFAVGGMGVQVQQPDNKKGGQLKPIRPLNQPLRALQPLNR